MRALTAFFSKGNLEPAPEPVPAPAMPEPGPEPAPPGPPLDGPAAAGAAEETEQVWQPYDPDEGYESDDGSVVTVYRHAFPAGWRTHWVLLGRGRLRRALGPLDAALPAFWAEERREGLTVHCHVGVLLPAATLRVS